MNNAKIEKFTCCICGDPKKDVIIKSTRFNKEIKLPYCQDCIDEDYEPYGAILSTVAMSSRFPGEYCPNLLKWIEKCIKKQGYTMEKLIKDAEHIQEILEGVD